MGGQTFPLGERDDSNVRITESLPVLAHGQHMFLTRQSHQMTMENQQHRATPKIVQSPAATVVLLKLKTAGNRAAETDRWFAHGSHGCRFERPSPIMSESLAAASPDD